MSLLLGLLMCASLVMASSNDDLVQTEMQQLFRPEKLLGTLLKDTEKSIPDCYNSLLPLIVGDPKPDWAYRSNYFGFYGCVS